MPDDVLHELVAERAIRDQLHTYCRAMDRLDEELLLSVWHEDGTISFGEDGPRGRIADLAGQMIAGRRALLLHSHQFTNALIEIDGDQARSEASTMDILRCAPDTSSRTVDEHVRARCLDHWSFRAGCWAIDHREVVEDLVWEQQGVDGHSGIGSRRDRHDPVYELLASIGLPRSFAPDYVPPDRNHG